MPESAISAGEPIFTPPGMCPDRMGALQDQTAFWIH